jgi:hypothetical protein
MRIHGFPVAERRLNVQKGHENPAMWASGAGPRSGTDRAPKVALESRKFGAGFSHRLSQLDVHPASEFSLSLSIPVASPASGSERLH